MDELPLLISRAESMRQPLIAAGFKPRLLLLLREPISTSISYYWFFNPTQGPLLPSLRRFALLRPEFALAALFRAFDSLPPALQEQPRIADAHGAWDEVSLAVKRAQAPSNELLESWARPLSRALRIGARTLAVAQADERTACDGDGRGAVHADAVHAGIGESCAAVRQRLAAVGRFIAQAAEAHERAALPWTRAGTAEAEQRARRGAAGAGGTLEGAVRETLANATRRYSLELAQLDAQRSLIATVHSLSFSTCGPLLDPLHAAVRRLDHVLLTDSLRAHVDRLLLLLGEPAVSAAELRSRTRRSGKGGAARGHQLRAARRRRRLQPSVPALAAPHAQAPQAWKSEREDRFVFNPSFYEPTANATRSLLVERSPCALDFHRHWTEHAPATLGLPMPRARR